MQLLSPPQDQYRPELAIVTIRIIELPVCAEVCMILQARCPSHVLDDVILAACNLPDAHLIHCTIEPLGGISAATKAVLHTQISNKQRVLAFSLDRQLCAAML